MAADSGEAAVQVEEGEAPDVGNNRRKDLKRKLFVKDNTAIDILGSSLFR